MYVESGCFDSMETVGSSQTAPNGESALISMDDISFHHHHHHQTSPPGVEEEEDVINGCSGAVSAAMADFHQRLGLEMDHCYNHHPINGNNLDGNHLGTTDETQNQVLFYDDHQSNNWDPNNVNTIETQDPNNNILYYQNHHLENPNSYLGANPSDLLNLLQLPNSPAPSSFFPNSSISFLKTAITGDFPDGTQNVMYDPLFHLNLSPQPPFFRDLFQSVPHGGGGSLVDHGITTGGGFQDGDGRHFDNGVLEFSREMKRVIKGKNNNGKGRTTHFPTEKQRREHLSKKYDALKNLVPNPTKSDRASIVGDAIDYIKELLRTVDELKLLVERKRCGRERNKRQKKSEDHINDAEQSNSSMIMKTDQSYSNNGPNSLRSSWLQRKTKDTEVDVRIIDDEVTIKLAQRKKINCLLIVSKVLDDFQLDIHHVAGGLVGDNYSFLLNSKICEDSCVYASAIANKLIEVVDKQYAAIPPGNGY
ncbi:transcription factor bHLH10-like [Impatiens glandulifera]|uniref:transcription factor bHLH10-like n=1 Tax=Impatiens glandulifera TaxID=253017 RepID=UPI001FB15F2B|nr:transcription factor bHLH10-like [Impatiens glandulifera]